MSVLTERHGAVFVVTINRPERRNAVNGPTAVALREAFEQFENDEQLSVAILTGSAGYFCAGADLLDLNDPQLRNQVDMQHGPMGPTHMLLNKPVIAAVEGPAVAGGLELACWADLRVVAEDAYFGVYCRRWGVPLIDGGTVRLPRLIGHSRAMDMMLTGRKVDAQEALNMGLANRVVASGQTLSAALAMAEQISQFPQACLRADRLSACTQWEHGLDIALLNEGQGGLPVLEEALSGAQRFAGGKGRHGDFGEI